jgi:hypothetical protein
MTRMPRGPRREKRPADVIGAAVMVAKIATGEIEDTKAGRGQRADGPAPANPSPREQVCSRPTVGLFVPEYWQRTQGRRKSLPASLVATGPSAGQDISNRTVRAGRVHRASGSRR